MPYEEMEKTLNQMEEQKEKGEGSTPAERPLEQMSFGEAPDSITSPPPVDNQAEDSGKGEVGTPSEIPSRLPKINVIQHIVNHVRKNGLQRYDDPESGLSIYGLEIQFRTEGRIPTEIITENPHLELKLQDQLVLSIVKGMFTEVHDRLTTLMQLLHSFPDAEKFSGTPSVSSYIHEVIQMLTDGERYMEDDPNQPVSPPEEIQMPLSSLTQAQMASAPKPHLTLVKEENEEKEDESESPATGEGTA